MSLPFSAARLRASASFVRLTGVSVATFDSMLKHLADPWEKAQLRKAKSGRPWDVGFGRSPPDHADLLSLLHHPGISGLLLQRQQERDLRGDPADRKARPAADRC